MRKSFLAYSFARNDLHFMNPARDIFQAIADPTRRQIIRMLADKPLNVNAIASQFNNITRQAVSLHIQFLNECELVTITKQGRERYCEANLQKLDVVTDWVAESRKIWMHQLKSLDNYLSKIEGKGSLPRKKSSKHGKSK